MNKKGKLYLWLIAFVILLLIGIYFFFSSTNNTLVVKEVPSNPFGLWQVQKSFVLNETSGVLQESELLFPVYMEYTPEGKWCVQWEAVLEGEAPSKNCYDYQNYTYDSQYILQSDPNTSGVEYRYQWVRNQEGLELTAQYNIEGKWTTIIKYVLVPLSRQ